MKKYLTAEGKGRQVTVPTQKLTPRFLLQLDFLRNECVKSWDEMNNMFIDICDIPKSFINNTSRGNNESKKEVE